MAKISQTFGASYYNADDFDGKGITLTIDRVGSAEVGKEERLVAYFHGTDKGLPLNKTNAIAIAEKLGDDTDDWEGKDIHIFRDKTQFQGKSTPCIRVRVPVATSTSSGAAAPVKGSGSGSGSGSTSGSPSAKAG